MWPFVEKLVWRLSQVFQDCICVNITLIMWPWRMVWYSGCIVLSLDQDFFYVDLLLDVRYWQGKFVCLTPKLEKYLKLSILDLNCQLDREDGVSKSVLVNVVPVWGAVLQTFMHLLLLKHLWNHHCLLHCVKKRNVCKFDGNVYEFYGYLHVCFVKWQLCVLQFWYFRCNHGYEKKLVSCVKRWIVWKDLVRFDEYIRIWSVILYLNELISLCLGNSWQQFASSWPFTRGCCFVMLPKGAAYSRRFVRLSIRPSGTLSGK